MNYDNSHEYNQEGEIITETAAPEIGTLAVLNKSEILQQITTARQFPRSIKAFRDEVMQLATLDEETAAECIYALPRDGKVIEGPSARFAEIINYSWGNSRSGARVIGEDDEFVTSQGIYYDLQKNVAISYEVKRRITNKAGKRYSADMIGTTSNAASSIALRNAILKGIPKALWRPMYEAARKVVAGDIRTLANRRGEALKAFQIYGVTPEVIYQTLGVKGVEDITIDHLVTLKGILTAIKEGDTSPEQAFAPPQTQDGNLAAKSATKLEEIKQRHAAANEPPANPPEPPAQPTPPQTAPEAGSTSQVQELPRVSQKRGARQSASEPQGIPLGFER
jgi:hypothetical protein